VVRNTLQRFIAYNRSEARSFVPPWQQDTQWAGMVGYLKERGVARRDRPDLFNALAEMPFAARDYAGLWRALRPGQRETVALAGGIARNAVLNGTSAGLVNELLDEQRRGALTTADRQLAIRLVTRDPNTAAILEPVLSDALMCTDPNDLEALSKLAEGLSGTGRRAGATALRRWCVARDAVQGYNTTRLDERLKRLEACCQPYAADDALCATALRALQSTPLDSPNDVMEAAGLEEHLKLGTAPPPEVLARVRGLLADDSEGTFRSAGGMLARYYAHSGMLDEFDAVVASLIANSAKVRMPRIADVIDCERWLPEHASAEAAAALSEHVTAVIESKIAGGQCLPAVGVRTLCLLGRWCVDNGLKPDAEMLLRRAKELAGPVSEPWLWLADLARLSGADDAAVSAELALLGAEMLPIARLPDLLHVIEQRDGQVAADELAVQAAKYTSHPEVLRRALRDAERRDDQDSARGYRQRATVWAKGAPPS